MATPTPGLASQTSAVPGNPVNALDVNLSGGYIFNPSDAPSDLYVDPVGAASATVANGTSMALPPGGTFYAIQGSTTPVSVASNSSNHQFVAVQWI